MRTQFDHERLKVYEEALKFCVWVGPLIEKLSCKLSVRDQLDRASTSIVLNLAEGNGKRKYPDRSRYFDTARGSAVECAACLDVIVARRQCDSAEVDEGKALLLQIVAMTAGLIARFSKDNDPDRVAEGVDEVTGLLDVILREKD